jgi:PAS domain S-box-containing protein
MKGAHPESRQDARWLFPYLIAALTAAAILLALLVVERLEEQRYDRVREARILRSLSSARARLEGELNERLFLTSGLVAYVSTHGNISVEEFQRLANVLFSQSGTEGIRSIQLAKDTVVSHVYPVKGNEEALGLRLLEHAEQKTAVQRALDAKRTVVAGPVQLVQGGTAFVSRTPIYLTRPGAPPDSERYWGLATILIDDGILLSHAGISPDSDGLQYALRGRDGMGADGEVFFGDPNVFHSNPLVLDIQIPGGRWQLAAVPLPNVLSVSPNLWLLRVAGGLLAVAAAGLAFFATLHSRQQAQETLRDNTMRAEAKFQALAENAQDPIVSGNSQRNIIYFNKEAQRVFGYEAGEVLGKPLTVLLPERLRSRHRERIEQCLGAGESHVVGRKVDVICQKKNGAEFPVELSLGSWTTEEGSFFTGIFRDVTEQKRAQEMLNQQRAFLRQVIDIDPNFIFAKDRAGRFTLVNQSVAATFGTSVEELIGKTDADFNPNVKEVESFRRMDLEVMDSLQERVIPEERITDAQGNIRWLQTVKRPIIGEDGRANHVLGSSTDITRRKLIEERLRENQKLYAMATAAGGVSVWALDVETGDLRTDPVLPTQLGIDAAESFPRDFWRRYIHPEDLARLLENEQHMLDPVAPRDEEGNSLMPEIEFRGLRSDGSVIWFLGRGTVIWDKDGKPLRAIGTCTDITARKQAEEHFRLAVEGAPNGIVIIGPHGAIVLANSQMEKMFGYTKTELLGQPIEMLVPARARDQHVAHREGFLAQPSARAMGIGRELYGLRKDGSEFPLEIGLNPLQTGGQSLILASVIDITERKQAESALRESEERLARTEKFSLVMATHADLEGRWLKVPPTLCELLGYAETELLGHRFHEVTHPEDVEADWSQCEQLIRGEIKSYDLEKRYIRKDGQIIWVYLNCSVVTDATDKPVHFLTYIRDITRRKHQEEKLREYQESLRQLANEVNTTQERERKKLAADLHDHIGQSLVLAKLELGQLGELTNALDERVHSSIERLEEIIDQALNETRSLTQDLSPQVLYALGFGAALEWLAENMQERYDLACRIEGGNQAVPLSGDAAVVAFQAVRELLVNVVKHAAVKEASVCITGKDGAVMIDVKDQGKGFAPDALDLPRSHGGGFGLFSTRERLSLFGGHLEIHSSPGDGTSARVVIPARDKSASRELAP